MPHRIDLRGSIKHLLLRLVPCRRQAWAVHRATGLHFRVRMRDVVGRHIMRYQAYEPALTGWLLAGFEQSPDATQQVFVDVGANLGWYSLQAAHHPKVGRVVAIEPDAGNQLLLQTNVERNGLDGKTALVACAIGAAQGMAQLHRYRETNLGRHSLLADHGHGSSWVPVETVDGLLQRLGLAEASIAAIKIDVEGYEPAVLAGAQLALRRASALLVELSPALSRSGGLDLPAMLDVIADAGFVPDIWDQPGAVPDFEGLRNHPGQVTVGFRRHED
jgi:FkbM family methyltransferase